MKGPGALQVVWCDEFKASFCYNACFIQVFLCVFIMYVGKSGHILVVLTALFTVLSHTIAKLSVILLHQLSSCPLLSSFSCIPSPDSCLYSTPIILHHTFITV